MDVESWLRSLGLGQYEAAFSENSIAADVLPDLRDGDLAQLGADPYRAEKNAVCLRAPRYLMPRQEGQQRHRGAGERKESEHAHQCRAQPFIVDGMANASVPIPVKPPVYNGMIAPRDSWMMPPPCNEIIPPGAPRLLAE